MTTQEILKYIKTCPKGMKSPVGYLSPDGKWFLVEESISPLVHLALSAYVYEQYKDMLKHVYGNQTEKILEHAGFIKIHHYDIRYFAKLYYSGYYDQTDCQTPSVTDIQIERIVEYGKEFGYKGDVCINDYTVSIFDLKQMDLIQRDRIFEI